MCKDNSDCTYAIIQTSIFPQSQIHICAAFCLLSANSDGSKLFWNCLRQFDFNLSITVKSALMGIIKLDFVATKALGDQNYWY